MLVPVTFEEDETVVGAPKNEVMEALALGFLAEESRAAPALRLRELDIAKKVLGRLKRIKKDSFDTYRGRAG